MTDLYNTVLVPGAQHNDLRYFHTLQNDSDDKSSYHLSPYTIFFSLIFVLTQEVIIQKKSFQSKQMKIRLLWFREEPLLENTMSQLPGTLASWGTESLDITIDVLPGRKCCDWLHNL